MKKVLIAVALPALLTGCYFDTDKPDVEELINERFQKAKQQVNLTVKREPIIPMKIENFSRPYEGKEYADPFEIEAELSDILNPKGGPDSYGTHTLNVDPERPEGYIPGLLEQYSLQELTLIGTIGTTENPKVLVKVMGENPLATQTVGLGDYMGTNFGRVVQIVPDQYVRIVEKFASDKTEEGWEAKERIINLEIK